MTIMKVAILLIVALVAGTCECATSCAAVKCESSCHHDKKTPEACSHQLVLHRASPLQAPESAAAMQTSVAIIPTPETLVLNRGALPRRDSQGAVVLQPLRI